MKRFVKRIVLCSIKRIKLLGGNNFPPFIKGVAAKFEDNLPEKNRQVRFKSSVSRKKLRFNWKWYWKSDETHRRCFSAHMPNFLYVLFDSSFFRTALRKDIPSERCFNRSCSPDLKSVLYQFPKICIPRKLSHVLSKTPSSGELVWLPVNSHIISPDEGPSVEMSR